MTEWYREWQSCEKEERVRPFFTTIVHRRSLDHINLTSDLVHFVSGHGPYSANLNRFGTTENEACVRRIYNNMPEHMLYQCPLADPGVENLRRRLGDVDTAGMLRDPERAKTLARLPEKVSTVEKEKFEQ